MLAPSSTVPVSTLEEYCAQAQRVPPAPARREVDRDPPEGSAH